MAARADSFTDIRDAVRALCADFPDEYFRKVDAARAYPAEFVEALTKAGWLAALIPQDYGGSGLGLMIVQRIIRAHGGRIEVESHLGRGTTFRVWLPLHERRPRLLEAPLHD